MATSHFHHNQIIEEKHIGCQGLAKIIIQKGNSWQTPSSGDEVEVHYSVQVEDGDYRDSTRDRGTPFLCKLGQCEVIKGWDEGISSMKKGERAIFRVPPELAYGEAGVPPLIPPNSVLIFDIELISWYPIKDVTGDGGIMKKIIKEGQGWATPSDDDEVLVKYVARSQNGAVVAESKEGKEFSLREGYLCPAMSIAAKSMRNNEKAELSVKFSYGFEHNENGNLNVDGILSPRSNWTILLELVSWKTVIDVTKDRKVLKKIMELGEGFDRPNEGSIVKVVYKSKDEHGATFESKGSDKEPFEYICAEEQIHDGLDRAVMTMRKGEQAIVRVDSDYLQGSNADKQMSLSHVFFEVKLVDFTKETPFWKMETEEKIETCQRKKNEGNALYRAGNYLRASKKYEKESRQRR